MLKREEIARIKEMYPKGTPIRLYSMEGEQSVPPGSRGVVDHVDDIGQIHMKWENGSCLALNIEVDRFDIITQQDDISEKKEQEFIDKVNEILDKTDFLLLNMSCNTENTSYAAETLLAMHQAFEEVYGEGYVDESYGMIMMPAVVRGRESGIKALALVTLDLESSGEHWGTTFLTPGGPLVQGNAELTEEQKRAIREYYIPYDYWYTPLVERDHHVNFTDMPETVANIRRLVDAELEYMVMEPRKEFITMVVLVVGNIPLLYFLNKDWYHTLMHTVVGQIMLSIAGIIIFVSTAHVIRLTKPIEYRS